MARVEVPAEEMDRVPLRMREAVEYLNSLLVIDANAVTCCLDTSYSCSPKFEAHPKVMVRDGFPPDGIALAAFGIFAGFVNEEPFRLASRHHDTSGLRGRADIIRFIVMEEVR